MKGEHTWLGTGGTRKSQTRKYIVRSPQSCNIYLSLTGKRHCIQSEELLRPTPNSPKLERERQCFQFHLVVLSAIVNISFPAELYSRREPTRGVEPLAVGDMPPPSSDGSETSARLTFSPNKPDGPLVSPHSADSRKHPGYRNTYINRKEPPIMLKQRAMKYGTTLIPRDG